MIVVRPFVELVPAEIGRILVAVGAAVAVASGAVEVDAVGAGVRENAVVDHVDTARLCLCAQLAEVVLRAEDRVDLGIVAGVVAVIGVGLADGIEIDAAHAKFLQVVELLGDALEVAHKKVGVGDLAVLVGLPDGKRVPVGVALKIRAAELLFFAAEAKAVGKDLIHHAAHRPARRCKALFVAGELPASARVLRDLADAVGIARNDVALAVCGVHAEAVPIQAHAVGRKVAFPNFGVLVKIAAPQHFVVFPVVVVVVFYAQLHRLGMVGTRRQRAKMNGRVLLYRAERRAVIASL